MLTILGGVFLGLIFTFVFLGLLGRVIEIHPLSFVLLFVLFSLLGIASVNLIFAYM